MAGTKRGDAVRVRTARPGDVPSLDRLERLAFRGDRLSPRRRLAPARGATPSAFLVAVRGEAVLGNALVFFRRGARRARLYSIAVSPDARGLGVGATLLSAAERAARRHGACELALEVRADNPVAIALYRSRGYAPIGTRPGYYFDGCDALRFVKRWPVAQ